MSDVFPALMRLINDYSGNKYNCSFDTTFSDLDLDSLDSFDLMTQIEEKFNIKFDDDIFVSSLGELAIEIEHRIRAAKNK